MFGRDRDARELRSVAPLLVEGELIGPVTLVQNGGKVIGVTDGEALRPYAGATLSVATRLDGSAVARVRHWGLSRYAGLGLVELAGPVASGLDVAPVDLGVVGASIDIRGIPTALVGIARGPAGFTRTWVPVRIDSDDHAGMSDVAERLASPLEDAHAAIAVKGAALFAWFPPNAALGRPSEVLVLGLAQAYRGGPRDRPVIAEICGLEDLGRALIIAARTEQRDPALCQVAGEIEDPGSSLDD